MKNVSERIKELRKDFLKISQQDFADKLFMKRNSITQIETGTRNPSERTIKTIIDTFNVNEEWLINGSGPIFRELTKEEEIAAYMGTLLSKDENSPQKRFIYALSKMDDDGWEVIGNLIDNIVKQKKD